VVEENPEDSATEIVLTELFSAAGGRRTALLGWIKPADIPEKGNFLDRAKLYL
jgi:hypothetical protein